MADSPEYGDKRFVVLMVDLYCASHGGCHARMQRPAHTGDKRIGTGDSPIVAHHIVRLPIKRDTRQPSPTGLFLFWRDEKMAVVTYGHKKTNIEHGTDLYEYLFEINNRIGKEALIIECDTYTAGIFRKRVVKKYRAYWDLGKGEYQIIMAATGESGKMEAYLIGILTGMDKKWPEGSDSTE